MTEIRALLVDDEPHARENLKALLEAEPHWRTIGDCDGAAALHEAIATCVPDVVFLDIRLPGADGIELARMLHQLAPRPCIVFTTAYESYAVAAFEVQAIDYLLKPFDDLRFQTALRRVESALVSATAPRTVRADTEPGPTHAPAGRYLRRLVIRSIGRVQFIDVAQIDWLEASGNYVEIHVGRSSFLHRERLRVLEEQLDPTEFVRIHRSLIVNRGAVRELRPLAGGDYSVLLRDGEPLRLSRTYRAALDSLTRGR
jgi:two-component system LytT family response regulator